MDKDATFRCSKVDLGVLDADRERRCNVPSTDNHAVASMTPEPDRSDFESLGNVLKRFGGKAAMNLEQLDGFICP